MTCKLKCQVCEERCMSTCISSPLVVIGAKNVTKLMKKISQDTDKTGKLLGFMSL